MSLHDFDVISKLGEGSFSVVYKVRRKSDRKYYALKKVKLLHLSVKEKENALNEIRILASINHPNIVGYKEAFTDSENSLYIVMDFSDGGDLLQKIKSHSGRGTRFSEENIWSYFIQIVKGLKTLHDMQIVHRDLKSANIFLHSDGSVKIGDLNVSKVAKCGLMYTQTGTPYYASPEVWKGHPYDLKCDIWSLGCVLYEMAALEPPFKANDMNGLFKKVVTADFEQIPNAFSKELSDTVRKLLNPNAFQRPTCGQILRGHPLRRWIDDFDDKHKANGLLNTIHFPKNLKKISEKLPKPAYIKSYKSLSPTQERKQIDLDLRKRWNSPRTKKVISPSRILERSNVRTPPLPSIRNERAIASRLQNLKKLQHVRSQNNVRR